MKRDAISHILRASDALLLIILGIPVIMRYGIFPSPETPYVLFGFIFLLLGGNVWYSIQRSKDKHFTRNKSLITIILIILVLINPMVAEIEQRGRVARDVNHHTHDIVLQLESAIRYLNRGLNPYKETYFGTPLEGWPYAESDKNAINPALYHFVMPPFYLLSSYPFYAISKTTVGFFDGRMPLVAATIGIMLISLMLFRTPLIGRICAIILTLNPATVDYLIEGRSDMLVLFWLLLCIFFLQRKMIIWSAIIFAFACTTKQSAWFMAPVLAMYLWFVDRRAMVKYMVIGTAIGAIICLPFFIWDASAFIESTILYLSGGTRHSYPISGYGLGMILLQLGVIKNTHAYYPFIYWQLGLGSLALIEIFRKLKGSPKISTIWFSYALVLIVVWYTSRYFNNSHIGFISSILAIGILTLCDEEIDFV